MVFILKATTVIYVTAGGAIIFSVVLYSAFTRQHFIAISVFIPYVDHTSSIGYMLTFVVHALMIVFCCNGYLASDTAFMATVVLIIGYANSLQNEIVNFNHLLTMPKRDEKLISEKMARIGHLHQMVVEFELDAVKHFQGGCLVQILTQAGAVLICIFLGYICGYVQAFSVLVGLCFQITQYCALGTIVTAKNEQITRDIYDIGWNLLQKPQQKMIVFMLHRAQVARDLTVGQMAPLNMVTYVKNEQITADIYDIGWNKLQKPQQQMVAFMLHRAQIARDLTVGQVAPLNMVTYVKVGRRT
ncbi:Odorant receptor 83c [Culex quinquefasciatus]|uniref:Odorant receptor 83c n=1 Tax=Culex quinquefasciatus TaxID=7176 RepID=B0XFE6_CULQU|nr:Odorant receptor 83c [Culex quinquefasciatus]|eukprot:XP_001868368.1 Odorant receptor 83c [Culex quinquefasciatus]